MREFVQVPAGFRQMLEELADLAVLLLDELDGDVDLEETGDLEPSLGSPAVGIPFQELWGTGDRQDRELNNDEDEGEDGGIGDEDGLDEQVGRHLGNGLRFLPADAVAVADARHRLGAIMDRVGGRR